jgi:hypothetical protein
MTHHTGPDAEIFRLAAEIAEQNAAYVILAASDATDDEVSEAAGRRIALERQLFAIEPRTLQGLAEVARTMRLLDYGPRWNAPDDPHACWTAVAEVEFFETVIRLAAKAA